MTKLWVTRRRNSWLTAVKLLGAGISRKVMMESLISWGSEARVLDIFEWFIVFGCDCLMALSATGLFCR